MDDALALYQYSSMSRNVSSVGGWRRFVELQTVWMEEEVSYADPGGSSSESSDTLVGLRGMRVPQ